MAEEAAATGSETVGGTDAPVTEASDPLGIRAVPDASSPESVATPWTDGFSEEDLAYISVKGLDKEGKGPKDLLKSYRNLERLRGVDADKLMKVPDWDNEEEVTAYRAKMGVPEAAEAYETPDVYLPEGLDTDVVKSMSHSLSHTPAQHKKFTQDVSEYFQGLFQAQAEERAVQEAADKLELQREWGAQWAENAQTADRTLLKFGIEDETVEKLKAAMGYRPVMELLTKIGRGIGEYKPATDSERDTKAPFGETPESARAEIQALKKDRDHYERLKAGHAPTKKHWENLNRIAYRS